MDSHSDSRLCRHSNATGMAPVNLLFRRAPLETLAMVALLWGISALPFYVVNDPLYRATGDYKFRLAWISYAARAALFVANVGFIALAYAFLVLTLAFLNLKSNRHGVLRL